MTDRTPFVLRLRIKSASNLPVADFMSSDPFVKIRLGDKEIGRTSTINRSLNPQWNEDFIASVLHAHVTLELKIYDEDRGQNPDLLGTVSLELKGLVGRRTDGVYAISNAGTYKVSASIALVIDFQRNLHLIALTPTDSGLAEKRRAVQDMALEPINDLRHDSRWARLPEIVQNTFLDLAVRGYSHYSSSELLEDLLSDVSRLATPTPSVCDGFIRRSALQLVAQRLDLDTKKTAHSPCPVEPNSLQINLSADGSRFILITLCSRLAVWELARLLRLGYDVSNGCGNKKPSALPSPVLIPHATVMMHGTSRTGPLTVNLQAMQLSGVENASIAHMTGIVLAASSQPKAYALELVLKPPAKSNVSVRCGEQLQQLHGEQSMMVDFNLSELNSARLPQDAPAPGHGVPPKVPSSLALDVYVSQADGREKLLAQKSIKVRHLLATIDASNPQLLLDTWQHGEFVLDSMTDLEITVDSAAGLVLPAEGMSAYRSLLVKVAVVDALGHHLKDCEPVRTSTASVSASVDWKGSKCTLGNASLDKAAAVRCEVLAEGLTGSMHLGCAFIPLDYFTLTEHSYTFPLSRFNISNTILTAASKRNGEDGLGALTVRIAKKVTSLPSQQPLSVPYTVRVHESSLFNNCWYAESMLPGDLFVEQQTVEVLGAAVLVEGLALLPHAHPASGDRGNWRQRIYQSNPQAVLACCRERASEQATVLIPWTSVQGLQVITPDLLSVHCKVERFMGEAYRPVEVMVFVSNCPAAEVAALIGERRAFQGYAQDIQALLSSGTVYGTASTDELSPAAQVMQLLDEEISRYVATQGTLDSNRSQRRMSRARLYQAALIGAQLQCDQDPEVLLEADCERANAFEQQTAVSTANNRIEFLLDVAEQRIRDAVICGLADREKMLHALQVFINGYYTEIVGLLTMIFDNTGQDHASTQGLSNKMDIIRTYLRHNDRLEVIISTALAPHALKATPAARLSPFVNFSVMQSWYLSDLTKGMKDFVDKTLRHHRGPGKADSARLADYSHPASLPWIPEQMDSGIFYSSIPEDAGTALGAYLETARIHKTDIAISLHGIIDELDGDVCVACTRAFVYLCSAYGDALKEKACGAMVDEEAMEYTTVLFAAANDAQRYASKIVQLIESQARHAIVQTEEVQKGIQQAQSAFSALQTLALEQLSCMLFLYTMQREHTMPLTDCHTWLACESSAFQRTVRGIMDAVADNQAFLNDAVYRALQGICTEKMIMLLLSVIRALRMEGHAYSAGHPFVIFFCAQVQWLRNAISAWSASSQSLDVLACLPTLFQEEDWPKLFRTVDALLGAASLSHTSSAERAAYEQLAKTCLSLRGMRKFFNLQQIETAAADKANRNSESSNEDHGHGLKPLSQSDGDLHQQQPQQTNKRGGFLTSLFHRPLRSGVNSNAGSTHGSRAATPPLPHHLGDVNEEEEMLQLKEDAVEECILKEIKLALQLAQADGPAAGHALSMAVLKVFQQADALNSTTSSPQDMLFAAAGLTHDNSSSGKPSKQSSKEKERPSLFGRASSPSASSEQQAPAAYFLFIKGLKVTDLFFLHYLQVPKPFFRIRLLDNGSSEEHRTSMQRAAQGTADWSEDEPFKLPVFHEEAARSSKLILELSLCYQQQGLLLMGSGAAPVAVKRIEIDPAFPPAFLDTTFQFDEFSSQQASAAAELAKREGRALPSLSFTMLHSKP